MDSIEEYLVNFGTYPPVCLAELPKKSGIYIFIQSIGNSHPYQYIGHAGNLLERVKQHLCEDSGTFTGNKKAVILNLDKLTAVGYFVTENVIDWPNNIEKPPRRKNDSEEKYEKKCRKCIAEALEEIAKKNDDFAPVLNDRNECSNKAQELIKDKMMLRELNDLLETEISIIELPDGNSLYKENMKLKDEIEKLKSKKISR
jgi:hypothetical protein